MAKNQQVRTKSKSKQSPKAKSAKLSAPKAKKLVKSTAKKEKVVAKREESISLSQLESLITRALGSQVVPHPPVTPKRLLESPATNFSAADLARGEAQLFPAMSETGDVADVPDSSGIWTGADRQEVDDSRTRQEDLLAFRGRTELHFEVLKNRLKALEDRVNEVYSFHRANAQGRGF